MASRRYAYARFTTNAGTVNGVDVVVAADDPKTRHVVGIYVEDHTDNVHVQLQRGTQVVSDIPHSAFNAAAGFVPVNATYVTGEEIHLQVTNGSGGAITTDFCVAYELDADR